MASISSWLASGEIIRMTGSPLRRAMKKTATNAPKTIRSALSSLCMKNLPTALPPRQTPFELREVHIVDMDNAVVARVIVDALTRSENVVGEVHPDIRMVVVQHLGK